MRIAAKEASWHRLGFLRAVLNQALLGRRSYSTCFLLLGVDPDPNVAAAPFGGFWYYALC